MAIVRLEFPSSSQSPGLFLFPLEGLVQEAFFLPFCAKYDAGQPAQIVDSTHRFGVGGNSSRIFPDSVLRYVWLPLSYLERLAHERGAR